MGEWAFALLGGRVERWQMSRAASAPPAKIPPSTTMRFATRALGTVLLLLAPHGASSLHIPTAARHLPIIHHRATTLQLVSEPSPDDAVEINALKGTTDLVGVVVPTSTPAIAPTISDAEYKRGLATVAFITLLFASNSPALRFARSPRPTQAHPRSGTHRQGDRRQPAADRTNLTL